MRAPILTVVVMTGVAPATLAQLSIDWHTIDGGGGTSAGGSFTVSGTIGQPDAGPVMSGGVFALTGGFWAGGSAGPTCPGLGPGACSRADWNEDGVVDFNDFLSFLNDFNAQDECADINQDSVVDFNDFLEFLNLYNIGC
ncbi:MAG: hypothetical protein FJ255_05545 [Phycisphaerae bacterium]|nr:hypothetical protein [Phycisphaerae bacterium]